MIDLGSAHVAPPVPTPSDAVEPGASVTQTTTDTTSTMQVALAPGWLHTNMRNVILLGVTGVVCYLALIGIAEARSGLIVTFTGLVSYLFAERASLKQPGKDT